MGHQGSSSDNGISGDGANGKMLGSILTAGLVLVGTGIGISCNRARKSARKHRAKRETSTKETPKNAIPCINVTERFANCLGSNGYDIKKCLTYFELLKDCERS